MNWGGCSSRAPQLGGLLCRAVRLCKSMELQTGSWGWGRMAPEGRHVGPGEGLGSDQTRAAAAAAWGTQLDSLGPSLVKTHTVAPLLHNVGPSSGLCLAFCVGRCRGLCGVGLVLHTAAPFLLFSPACTLSSAAGSGPRCCHWQEQEQLEM